MLTMSAAAEPVIVEDGSAVVASAAGAPVPAAAAAGGAAGAAAGAAMPAAAAGKKRGKPGGCTDEWDTVKNWDDSKWIYGNHEGATAIDKATARDRVKKEYKIICRGCMTPLQSNSKTWKRHVTSTDCIATRADPKNWFNGMVLTALRPTAALKRGALRQSAWSLSL